MWRLTLELTLEERSGGALQEELDLGKRLKWAKLEKNGLQASGNSCARCNLSGPH